MDKARSELCSGSASTKYSNPHKNGKEVPLTRREKNLARRHHDLQKENQNGIPANNMSKSNVRGWRSVISGHGKINRQIIINASALRLHSEMNLTNRILSEFPSYYILSSDQLLHLGYPVGSPVYPGKAIIYKDPAVFTHFHTFHTIKRQCY
jgi:hypothetical protein